MEKVGLQARPLRHFARRKPENRSLAGPFSYVPKGFAGTIRPSETGQLHEIGLRTPRDIRRERNQFGSGACCLPPARYNLGLAADGTQLVDGGGLDLARRHTADRTRFRAVLLHRLADVVTVGKAGDGWAASVWGGRREVQPGISTSGAASTALMSWPNNRNSEIASS